MSERDFAANVEFTPEFKRGLVMSAIESVMFKDYPFVLVARENRVTIGEIRGFLDSVIEQVKAGEPILFGDEDD